ncbi:hypothetical protein [Gracilimonas sediminicola]|uniref:Uncharacterized protein n=1 Tax=Gracilimonas sediminicola TaxID=2952158 RepID=A0A9X2L3Q7_9BACT|nr:hypothetical protein [Gracilimonas sediminicola]MCP9291712.1 hypothetical protein [Gracilimonas sediminicola]
MKKLFTLTFAFAIIYSVQLSAQLREDLPRYNDFSGPIINSQTSTVQTWLNDFFQNNVTMSHSYSMSFGAVGGSYQNVNAYTNTLNFMFTPDLTGRVDVSFLHSPFGGSDFVNTNNNLGGQVLIRNAELNYKISDNARIQLQYQQLPAGYGYHNPYGFGAYGYNRFNPWY